MEKICKICGKKFKKPITCSKEYWLKKRKYCSYNCWYRSVGRTGYKRNGIPRPIKKCEYCGREFQKGLDYNNVNWNRRRFCSSKCSSARFIVKAEKKCVFCGKIFRKRLNEGKINWDKKIHCSHKCAGMNRRGEKNHLWQGGKSFEPYSPEWTETLKTSIRQRDKYTCQLCGKNPVINVHHKDYEKKNCDPNNLITLCKTCHNYTNFNRDYWKRYWK